MSKPRKSTKQGFYDEFLDFDLADQAIVLEFLQEMHRQAKRQAAKRWTMPEKEAAAAVDGVEK